MPRKRIPKWVSGPFSVDSREPVTSGITGTEYIIKNKHGDVVLLGFTTEKEAQEYADEMNDEVASESELGQAMEAENMPNTSTNKTPHDEERIEAAVEETEAAEEAAEEAVEEAVELAADIEEAVGEAEDAIPADISPDARRIVLDELEALADWAETEVEVAEAAADQAEDMVEEAEEAAADGDLEEAQAAAETAQIDADIAEDVLDPDEAPARRGLEAAWWGQEAVG